MAPMRSLEERFLLNTSFYLNRDLPPVSSVSQLDKAAHFLRCLRGAQLHYPLPQTRHGYGFLSTPRGLAHAAGLPSRHDALPLLALFLSRHDLVVSVGVHRRLTMHRQRPRRMWAGFDAYVGSTPWSLVVSNIVAAKRCDSIAPTPSRSNSLPVFTDSSVASDEVADLPKNLFALWSFDRSGSSRLPP